MTTNYITRLNQNGSIDNTFNSGTGFDIDVNLIIQDTNDKYVIGGNFTSYSGVTTNYITRLNQNGSIDNTFNSGTGFNGLVRSIIQDINDKYVIGGNFTSYHNQNINKFIELNQDGTSNTITP